MEAKKFINKFYQPLGFLSCDVSNAEMWEYAKKRALEVCSLMLEEYSCYTLNDNRWAVWSQLEKDVQSC